ncbi:kinesin-domain-containing protein [Coniophora puteana RWD-64-598 SS2]|uniref:Kinesin-domain-containing protein n=1 Tax=Coniophora puteana (strain RWD-64-598) TaxID=741705 RepID=A0A5M3N2S3_CONPW|nr:kinesin-domain-containing protein [Coniophora puteana RWD-64-598 SS2]EIW85175.1 kinesin-domain-containing protein [Coniophora puteana RWD-64-598 SS2]
MASRRPPSSRSRATPTSLPTSRSRIATSNANAQRAPTPASEVRTDSSTATAGSSSSSRLVKSSPQGESETNIQVVIRCRRRNDREIQENSPIIATSAGAKSQDVTIETAIPVSSLGVVTLAPTRTYPFDLVFGPEADQAMIYHDVVSPMLNEVLMGYNCTLFAYGQTGTGKTYTMQGDLTPTPMGNPSANAGMIPRVLFRLFHQLETSAADYSVKISFVELYNEELRDLLANELAPPAGSAQPMGKGGAPDNGQGGLKIFDDSGKKGVFIQGLEEIPVKDSKDALALLTKGSHRRQIAATKFNDHSSRSHSVFSITVHIKEKSTMGDDLLKVGKLNLVDLAGSENIGRSGAENKRAREAGMINQSLLTLGRVINALVDKSSHIPYRESKLTRLLQDSLGGRTKTCIIATISPARSNMEETLSTLDYALRAKSIRNKPEVNQRMNRNSLLKEYIAEIERLKADVLAAREKNGIFFSEETWNQLSAEQELRQTEMHEAKKQVEIVESHLRNVREEFEQSIGLLMKRDGELKEAKEQLKETRGELAVRDGLLKAAKGALEEEIVIRQAYQTNEETLDGVASGLKLVAGESVTDLSSLFDKIQRKTSQFNSNAKAVSTYGRSIGSDVQRLTSALEAFNKTFSSHAEKLRSEIKQFQTKELESMSSHSERIDHQLKRVQDSLKVIQTKDEVSADALVVMQNAVQESQTTLKSGFVAWSESLRSTCKTVSKESFDSNLANLTAIENAFMNMDQLMSSMLSDAMTNIQEDEQISSQASTTAEKMSQIEIARLQAQNTQLTKLLEAERAKSQKAKDELVKQISDLLAGFVASRDSDMCSTFGFVAHDNAKGEEEMKKHAQQHRELMAELSTRHAEAASQYRERGVEAKRTRDGALKSLGTAKTSLEDSFAGVQTVVTTATSTYSGELQRNAQSLNASFMGGLDRHNRAKRARIDATSAMSLDVDADLRQLQHGLSSSSRHVESHVGKVNSETGALTQVADQYHREAGSKLGTLKESTKLLIDNGTKEDVSTGLTPRKREWEYVDHWELTGSRDAILKSWKGGDSSKIPSLERSLSALSRASSRGTNSPVDMEDERTPSPESVCEPEPEPELQQPNPTPPISLSSSASSTTTLAMPPPPALAPAPASAPPPPLKKAASTKSGLPGVGTLAEKPTNTLPTRQLRRIR